MYRCVLINKESVKYINEALKYSIKEYLVSKEKIILYDMLLTCSILSETPMFCSETDFKAFCVLRDNCKQANIPLDIYVSCAYSYIMKYHTKGHRIGLGYFLNDNVVTYCGEKVDSTKSSLLLDEISEDILSTEKRIREDMATLNCSYGTSFSRQFKWKRISDVFITYKKFVSSPLVEGLETPYLTKLITILEPYFTYILAKNCIYTPHNLKNWNNSKIEDFSFCPIYFKDRYITGELVDSILGNEATTQGTKVHKIFEDIFTNYNKSKTKNLPATATRYFKSKAYLEVKEELSEHTTFVESLFLNTESSILYTLIDSNTEILVENTMTATLSGQGFYGTADLILINGSKATILDYKSSKLDPKYLPKNNEKYLKQLSLYAKLLLETRPDIKSVDATIIYTRGLIYPFQKILDSIGETRASEITEIIQKLTNGMIAPNTSSCFLCRHPNCSSRKKASIWNSDGTRIPSLNKISVKNSN